MKIDLISRHLTHHFGLLPRWRSEVELEKEIQEIAALNSLSFRSAAQMMGDGNLHLLKQLAARFTIGESFVLRHEEHFAVLVSEFARWRETQPRLAPIRIWCAGCAKGEEPYTAAALAFETFEAAAYTRVQILANDINAEAIHQAQKGVYGSWSFRGVDDNFKNRHFTQVEGGRWSARKHLRDIVTFEHSAIQEVLTRTWATPFDVIFFRNVAVYLDPQRLHHLYEGFRNALHPEGLLFIAPSDPMPSRDMLRPSGLTQNPTILSPVATSPAHKQHSFESNPPPTFQVRTPKPPPGARSETDVLAHRAEQLGNAGKITEAIQTANAVVDAAPGEKSGYALRARLHLSNDNPKLAAADFKRALELDSKDDVIRYWYALSLHSLGDHVRCATELRHILENLDRRSPTERLSDNTTTVAELHSAVERLHEALV